MTALSSFRIAIFAHNEERFIERAIQSVVASAPDGANFKVYVLINGSKDRTAEIVRRISKENHTVTTVEIELGDKCNAWNTYVYYFADDAPLHFFMDGDCRCSPQALEKMAACLERSPQAVAVGGVPQSGRSRAIYRQYQKDWGWVFGNLYAVRHEHLAHIRDAGLRLPIGLKGNDHFVTRFLHAPLPDTSGRVPSQVVFDEDAGYLFDCLDPFSLADARIYWNRLIVYRLRQRQIPLLNDLPLDQLPEAVDQVNRQILTEISRGPMRYLHPIEFALYRRLRRMYSSENAMFYGDKLGLGGGARSTVGAGIAMIRSEVGG